MPLDIESLLQDAQQQNYDLHAEHVNPKFVKTLKTIGFDKCYTRAEGAYLWDEKGDRYLDMLSGYGVFNFGRNNPEIKQALIDFMQQDYASLVQMEAPLLSGLLAKELKQHVPFDLGKVYFTSTGAECVETAIKFARCATGRSGILFMKKAFHGLSNGALSLNGDTTFREGFGSLLPDCDQIPFNDLNALEEKLKTNRYAAFIFEPVQGKGVNIPDSEFFHHAQKLCREYGALLIDDEVQSGMGRTGKFLAIEHEHGVEPDMVLLSKSLSGGYVPVGAVMVKDWIYEKVFSSMERSVVHSSTFGQGSLAMIAGLAAINYMDEHHVIANAQRRGDQIGHALLEMKERYEFISDIRWRGLMIGIEFDVPHSIALKAAWKLAHKLDKSLFPQAITMPLLQDHRILTQVAGHHINVIKLIPPLILNDEQVTEFVIAFDAVMKQLHKFPGPVWEVISRVGKAAVGQR